MARPVRGDADATREPILELALEAFADADYEAVSVRELIRRFVELAVRGIRRCRAS